MKAAELGVSSAADVYIRKLDTATKSTHALGLKSAMARREIGVLIGELAREILAPFAVPVSRWPTGPGGLSN